MNEISRDGYVVARHNHFGALGEMCNTGDVGGAEVELRTITIEERSMTAAFFLGKDVNLTLKFLVRSYSTGLAENLATQDVLTLDATEQTTDVVASLSLVKQLAEHFDAGANGLLGILDTNDFEFVVYMQNAALNTTSSNGATAGDGHGVLNSHQEGLVDSTLGSRNVLVYSIHKLPDLVLPFLVAFEGLKSGTANNRAILEAVGIEKLGYFHLNELEELFVVNHVALVQENNDVGNANLTSKQDVLTSLSHRAVGCSDNEDSAVHLSSTGDHVLDVVSMAGAVNVCIVTLVGFILNVRNRNGNAALALFRSLVDVLECGKVCGCSTVRTVIAGQGLRNCSSQRGLAVVNVADSTNVNMRLRTLELLLRHYSSLLVGMHKFALVGEFVNDKVKAYRA